MSVLVAGDGFVDVLASKLEGMPVFGQDLRTNQAIILSVGGCAQNTASTLANLGVRNF
jgi:sugar/nucleoside kinase (ribokinase family)